MPTVYEICQQIKVTGPNGKVASSAPSIVAGMRPEPVTLRPGDVTLTPEQILSLVVPHLTQEGGEFVGFQRDLVVAHARGIARSLLLGIPIPVVEIALLPGGQQWMVEGQHRSVAAVIARKPMKAIVREMTEEQAQLLFTHQAKARRINPNVTVLSSSDPFSTYIQDVLTSKASPWAPIVGQQATTYRISPKQAFNAISAYCCNSIGRDGRSADPDKFDRGLCDELGLLVAAFGTKQTNPLAFRPVALAAITTAAIKIVRRRGSELEDIVRWRERMPQFPFGAYQHLRREAELTSALIDHWNRGLRRADRKVDR